MLSGMAREPHRRIVLWDPLAAESGSNRFIVSQSNAVNMYDWKQKTGEITVVATHPLQQDQSALKCLAWSPHPTYDDLVATGSSSGKVSLLRLRAAIGSTSDGSNISSTPAAFNLLGRNSRSLNALAFSPHDANLLAVGTDKARNEPGLTVWDIESAAKSLPSVRPPSENPTAAASQSQPSFRSPLRVAVASNESRTDSRICFQSCIGEAITSVAFLPHTPATLLIGAAAKWVRVIDMRSPGSGAQAIGMPDNIGLCVDPFDEGRFASYGDEGFVQLWDRRHLSNPMLSFSAVEGRGKQAGLFSIAFSGSRRGLLGSLSRDSPVRIWNVVSSNISADVMTEPSVDGSQRINAITRSSQKHGRLHEKDEYPYATLSRAHLTQTSRGTSSFCFVTSRSDGTSRTPRILAVKKDGMLQISPILETPQHHWSSRGELAVVVNNQLQIRRSQRRDGERLPADAPEPWEISLSAVEDSEAQTSSPQNDVIALPSSDIAGGDDTRVGRSLSLSHHHQPPPPPQDLVEWPPLPVVQATSSNSSLSATRPSRSARTFSPSAMRRYALRPRSSSRTPLQQSEADLPPLSPPKSKGGSNLPDPGTQSAVTTSKRKPSKTKAENGLEQERISRLNPSKALRNDISMVMKRRMLRGYGLENAVHNATIASEDPVNGDVLSEVWRTLARWTDVLRVGDSSKVEGFDFAYQGLLGIWEGFPPYPVDEPAEIRSSTPLRPDSPSTMPPGSRPPSIMAVHRVPLGSQHARDGSGTESSAPTNLKSRRGSTQYPIFDAAVDALNERRSKSVIPESTPVGMSYPVMNVKTSRPGRRKLALALSDWDLTKEEFVKLLQRWESSGESARAACWAVLMKDYNVATEFLMRSKDQFHVIIAGTVAALLAQRAQDGTKGSPQLNPWIENCQRMIVRIPDPYIRIMLAHLIDDPWIEILQDEAIPLNDRLGIIFRFLDDHTVTKSLQETFATAKRSGNLEGLLFTGLTPAGMDLFQAYVDSTGDVQTAAIMASYVSPARFKDNRVDRWVETYHNLLDSWSAFHFRCQFDIERGRMLQHLIQAGEIAPFEWVERQLLIRCNYCNKVINSQLPLTETVALGGAAGITAPDNLKTTRCPSCSKPLPRCVVCLMTVGVHHDVIRDAEMLHETSLKDTLDDALLFCQTCRHGGHASHILDWFFGESGQPHETCPVADCDCRCNDL